MKLHFFSFGSSLALPWRSALVIAVIAFSGLYSSQGQGRPKTKDDLKPPAKSAKAGERSIRWTHWFGGDQNQVYVDGKFIGHGDNSAVQLAEMTFPTGTRVRIELPSMGDGVLDNVAQPYFEKSNFLQIWLRKGAELQFFVDGDVAEIHTLLRADSSASPLTMSAKDDSEEDIFFRFDGELCKGVSGTISAMARATWSQGSTLLILGEGASGVPHNRSADEARTGLVSVVAFLNQRKVRIWRPFRL